MKYLGNGSLGGINNRNQLVGTLFNPNPPPGTNTGFVIHAALWNSASAKPIDLGALGTQPGISNSSAGQINDHGQIVGTSDLGASPGFS